MHAAIELDLARLNHRDHVVDVTRRPAPREKTRVHTASRILSRPPDPARLFALPTSRLTLLRAF